MALLDQMLRLAFMIVLLNSSVADVQLQVSTSQIKVGCTDALTINCSVSGKTRADLKYITSIVLYMRSSPNDTTYKDVASIAKIGSQDTVFGFYDNVTAQGDISALNEAYLLAQWRRPTSRLAGEYMCTVSGLDEVGHSVALYGNSSVTEAVSDVVDPDRIKEIEAQIEEKWNTIKNELIAENQLWADRFQELKSVLFTKEMFYNHHHYFLSGHVYKNIDVAAALCRLYSGYLVQIDDGDEYNAIDSFLRGVTEFDSVFISGTDQGHEGHWVYQGTNTSMGFQVWGQSAPNGGNERNCMVLYHGEDWKMYDQPCYDSALKVSAICEKSMVV